MHRYDAYNVEAAETHFTIDVRFRQCQDPNCAEFEDTVLTVGPHNREAKDKVTDSTVEFIGECSPFPWRRLRLAHTARHEDDCSFYCTMYACRTCHAFLPSLRGGW
jgi:hypothetical protein